MAESIEFEAEAKRMADEPLPQHGMGTFIWVSPYAQPGGKYRVTLVPIEEPNLCPFCGGEGMTVGERFSGYCVQCADCHATGPTQGNKSEATSAWNRRCRCTGC